MISQTPSQGQLPTQHRRKENAKARQAALLAEQLCRQKRFFSAIAVRLLFVAQLNAKRLLHEKR